MGSLVIDRELDLNQHLSILSRQQSQIYFLQIGAFDGVTGDDLYRAVHKFSLSGAVVEPQKEAFRLLQANYSGLKTTVTLLNVAISEHDGRKPFYVIDGAPPEPYWLPQLASFSKDVILSHRHAIPGLEAMIRTTEVDCWSFDTLFLRLNRQTVDLLYIDTEGYDANLLWAFDVPRRAPSIIVFEHKHLLTPEYLRAIEMLLGSGYSVGMSRDSINDTIALRLRA
jgi:FkbM family methyltransferase